MPHTSQHVEVQLEIGHIATPKLESTSDGHTHDCFPKPKRVIKEPPYEIKESGYASFELPIEVYFRNKEEPKKICFEYDLYIELAKPVANTRRERLTFQNPSIEFKKKLLKGCGNVN
nr:protein AF-9-like [Dermatophagoides farinae]